MTDVQLFSDRLNLPDPLWDSGDLEFCSSLWKRDGILAGTRRYDYVRCPCGEGHCEEVRTRMLPTGEPEFYIRCGLTGHRQVIPQKDLIGWTFSGEAFAKVLKTTFPCSGGLSEIVRGRLWKLCSSDTPLGKRRRDIYFATQLCRDSRIVFDNLPDTDTPLLIHGSSLRENSDTYRNRVFSMYDVVFIAADCWQIDYAYIDEQLEGRKHGAEPAKPKLKRGQETIARLEDALRQWIEAQYRERCECRAHGREFRYKAPTMGELGGMIGRNKSTVSDLLEDGLNLVDRKHHELTVLWETSKDEDAVMRYAQKRFGSPGRRE